MQNKWNRESPITARVNMVEHLGNEEGQGWHQEADT
jgi:hypothetical protein